MQASHCIRQQVAEAAIAAATDTGQANQLVSVPTYCQLCNTYISPLHCIHSLQFTNSNSKSKPSPSLLASSYTTVLLLLVYCIYSATNYTQCLDQHAKRCPSVVHVNPGLWPKGMHNAEPLKVHVKLVYDSHMMSPVTWTLT